jgi:hypothetical protein
VLHHQLRVSEVRTTLLFLFLFYNNNICIRTSCMYDKERIYEPTTVTPPGDCGAAQGMGSQGQFFHCSGMAQSGSIGCCVWPASRFCPPCNQEKNGPFTVTTKKSL